MELSQYFISTLIKSQILSINFVGTIYIIRHFSIAYQLNTHHVIKTHDSVSPTMVYEYFGIQNNPKVHKYVALFVLPTSYFYIRACIIIIYYIRTLDRGHNKMTLLRCTINSYYIIVVIITIINYK